MPVVMGAADVYFTEYPRESMRAEKESLKSVQLLVVRSQALLVFLLHLRGADCAACCLDSASPGAGGGMNTSSIQVLNSCTDVLLLSCTSEHSSAELCTLLETEPPPDC